MEDNDPASRIISLIQTAAIATAAPAAIATHALPAILVVVGNGNVVGSSAPTVAHHGAGIGPISSDQVDQVLGLLGQWMRSPSK